MKRTLLSLALPLALIGCASDPTGSDEPTPDPNPEPEPPARTLQATGSYRLHTGFDLAASMPGNQGTFVGNLISATDDPDDPMSWVLDQMLATMDPGTLKSILQGAKPFVAGFLNEQLIALAPNLVGTIDEIGDRMADLTHNFGLHEKLVVTTSDGKLVGNLTVDGLRFQIDGVETVAFFADHDTDNVYVDNVGVTLENEQRLLISEHALSLPYGTIVQIGLDAAVIPAIDPTATDLADLLDNVVDCAAVGVQVADAIDVGSPAFWESVCHAGLDQAAGFVYGQIADADAPLDLVRSGASRVIDANDDYKVDQLAGGTWTGTLTYEAETKPLAQPAAYTGTRL